MVLSYPPSKNRAITGLTTVIPRALLLSGDAKDESWAEALAKVNLQNLEKEYAVSASGQCQTYGPGFGQSTDDQLQRRLLV